MMANALGFGLYNIVEVLVADMAEVWRIVEKEVEQEGGRLRESWLVRTSLARIG